MRFSIKKAILSGLLTVSALATSLVAVALPAAAANPTSISIANQSVANGATFNVPILLSTTLSGAAGVAGAQANVTFDPAKLRANTVTYTSGLFGASQFNVSVTTANGRIDNVGGVINNLTSTTGGDPAIAMNGTWATINFTALVSNTTAALTLQPFNGKYAIDAGNNTIPVDITSGVITIGVPALPDLTVSNVTTAVVHAGTSAPTDPATYTVSFQVNNIGTLAAGASTAYVAIDGGAPLSVAVAGIAAGANSGTLTSSVITFSPPLDSIVVTADATNAVVESNESNNTASSTFTYQYPVAGQKTDINGNIVGTISFTQPSAVTLGQNMQIGPNTVGGTLNVVTNQSWTVSVQGLAPVTTTGTQADIDAGRMTKLTGTTYNPYIKLHNQLHTVSSSGYLTPYQIGPTTFVTPTNADVTMTGTAQVLAFGIPEGQVTSTDGLSSLGENRTLAFNQTVLASDPSLMSGSEYHEQMTFTVVAVAW